MTAFSYFICYFFEMFISYIYFTNKFEKKKKDSIIFSCLITSMLLQYGVHQLGIMPLNVTSFFGFNALVLFYCYRANIKQIIINSSILAGLMLSTEVVVIYFVSGLLNMNLAAYDNSAEVVFFLSLTSKILFFSLAYILSKISFKEKKNQKDYSLPLIIMPIASLSAITGIGYLLGVSDVPRNAYYLLAGGAIFILAANVVIFFVHEKIITTLSENTLLQLEKQRQEINEEYYKELEHQQNISSILVHDIKRHLRIINEFAEKNETDKIKDYINSVYENDEIYKIRQFSSNKIINVIVSRYAHLCDENEIDFSADIRDVDFKKIVESDWSTLVDNLLENAYESALKSDKKFIEFKIDSFGEGFVTLNVKNSCDYVNVDKNGQFITLKDKKKQHGIGIKSINKTAKKYDGETEFIYDKNTKTFSSKVGLKTDNSRM